MRHLWELIKRYDYVLLFIALIACSIIMMIQNTYYQRSVILKWSAGIVGNWSSRVSSVNEYLNLKGENDKLAKENASLRAKLAESYMSYSATTFKSNDTIYNQRYTYTEAKVIKNSWAQHNNYIMINKGSKQGIQPDMAVMSPNGIVGVVANCTNNFSTVMSVLHSSSQHSVKVKRIGTNGTLKWDGKDYRYATVIDIPTTHKLYKNDTIITSGMANDFPEGILVGYVTALSSNNSNGFYEIKIRLATDFNELDHVYVIENRFKEEQDELYQYTSEN